MTKSLLTDEQRKQLIVNHGKNDPSPVVKLYTPFGLARWLLCEINPSEPDVAYGLCDLGVECVEYGAVYLPDLEVSRVCRDDDFKAVQPISAYAQHAREHSAILA